MILNESGLRKLADYLGDHRVIKEDGVYYLSGKIDDSARENLSSDGIIIESVDDNMHWVKITEQALEDIPVEDSDIETGGEEELRKGIDINNEEQMRALAAGLIPYISEHIPTKEEINKALDDLKDSMIDPDEWMDMLKRMMRGVRESGKTEI